MVSSVKTLNTLPSQALLLSLPLHLSSVLPSCIRINPHHILPTALPRPPTWVRYNRAISPHRSRDVPLKKRRRSRLRRSRDNRCRPSMKPWGTITHSRIMAHLHLLRLSNKSITLLRRIPHRLVSLDAQAARHRQAHRTPSQILHSPTTTTTTNNCRRKHRGRV